MLFVRDDGYITSAQAAAAIKSPLKTIQEPPYISLGQEKRALEVTRQGLDRVRAVLELNPGHPLVEKLKSEDDNERFGELSLVLFEQALLSEGAVLEDPAAFVRRVNRLMLG